MGSHLTREHQKPYFADDVNNDYRQHGFVTAQYDRICSVSQRYPNIDPEVSRHTAVNHVGGGGAIALPADSFNPRFITGIVTVLYRISRFIPAALIYPDQ